MLNPKQTMTDKAKVGSVSSKKGLPQETTAPSKATRGRRSNGHKIDSIHTGEEGDIWDLNKTSWMSPGNGAISQGLESGPGQMDVFDDESGHEWQGSPGIPSMDGLKEGMWSEITKKHLMTPMRAFVVKYDLQIKTQPGKDQSGKDGNSVMVHQG